MGGLDPPNQKTASPSVEKLDRRVKPAGGEKWMWLN